MKTNTIKLLILLAGAIILLALFTSCETEDYSQGVTHNYVVVPTETPNYEVPIQQVLATMEGVYRLPIEGQARQIETAEVIITDTIVSIKTDTIDEYIYVQDSDIVGELNCFIEITMPDGRVIKLMLGWLANDVNRVRNLLFIKVNGQFVPNMMLKKIE